MVNSAISRSLPVFILMLFTGSGILAQDTDRLKPEFHASRRNALRELLPRESVAIFFANPVRNRNNSVDFQFSQHPDLYYLTGYTEPDAMLLLFSDSVKWGSGFTNEILFAEGPNTQSSTWSGPVPTSRELSQKLGISTVLTNSVAGEMMPRLCNSDLVFLRYPEFPRKAGYSEAGLPVLVELVKKELTSCPTRTDSMRLSGWMARLREVKQPEELMLIQKAIDLTMEGFREMIKTVKPGMTEYQAQAVVEYVAKYGGAEYQGYPSISGSGMNACVLHYSFNRKNLESGELLLADMGAEYHGYTADITRTIPVNGKFTAEQAILYNLVLAAQTAGIEACQPGNSFLASHIAAKKVIAEGLLRLGIIKSEEEVMKYFMHGTSHYLGLDVHDAGTKAALRPGTVLTVEPGIYIRKGAPCDPKWWNTGIRIEDDILVTEEGPVNLSAGLVRDIAGIEALLMESGRFEQEFK